MYAVHLVLAKDWLIRIISLWRMYRDQRESERYKQVALVGLFRLLGGEAADNISWYSSNNSSFVNELREHIHKVMIGTVERRLDKWYGTALMNFKSEACWVLKRTPRKHRYPESQQRFFDMALLELSKLCLQDKSTLKICRKALLNRGFGSKTKSEHERLEVGDVIQILIPTEYEDRTFPSRHVNYKSSPSYYTVGGFIQCITGVCWALVRKCTLLTPSSVHQLPKSNTPHLLHVRTADFYCLDTQPQFQYMELTSHVKKVGCVHNCEATKSCTFCPDSKRVFHSKSTLDGSNFFILSRSMAYPPRRS